MMHFPVPKTVLAGTLGVLMGLSVGVVPWTRAASPGTTSVAMPAATTTNPKPVAAAPGLDPTLTLNGSQGVSADVFDLGDKTVVLTAMGVVTCTVNVSAAASPSGPVATPAPTSH